MGASHETTKQNCELVLTQALFVRKNKKDDEYNRLKKEKQELFRQLGESNYEKEWLKKKYRQLYGKDPD